MIFIKTNKRIDKKTHLGYKYLDKLYILKVWGQLLRKFIYFVLALFLFLAVSCESPTKNTDNEQLLPKVSSFNRSLLKIGNNCGIGYYNGRIQSSEVNLTWTETGEEDFKLYSLVRDGSAIAVFNDITDTAFTDTLVSQNTFYNYSINVLSENGMVYTDTISIKTAKLEPPTNLSVNVLNETGLSLSWDDNSDSESFFGISIYENSTLIDSTSIRPNARQKFFNDIAYNRNYNFTVAAVSIFEDSILSTNPVYVDVDDLCFYPPTDLTIKQFSNLTVQLNWTDNSELETGYVIERKINDGNFEEISSIQYPNVNNFTDMGFSAYEIGDDVTYRVRGCNNDGVFIYYSEYTNENSVNIREIINSLTTIQLTVDGNPAEASWNLRSHNTGQWCFEDYQTFDYPHQTLTVELDLEPGSYRLQCLDSSDNGGISGVVSRLGNLIGSWTGDSYEHSILFIFYVKELKYNKEKNIIN